MGVDRQLEQLANRGNDEANEGPIELEKRVIERAVANGFALDRVEQLRTSDHGYGLWRVELRDDPPEDVPPLAVRWGSSGELYPPAEVPPLVEVLKWCD
ncbi:hypothetical protein PI124_g13300 [Phytophthora idaei]|nr:hypothetical protein PI125_g23437 [Phytophthora idaei]KAG3128414.1 hypothetical protein PI126_g21412 [Phytophthora idaei]KAG3241842.1 hypothetical protein PI124_g13300 [Phytophthora idaei]